MSFQETIAEGLTVFAQGMATKTNALAAAKQTMRLGSQEAFLSAIPAENLPKAVAAAKTLAINTL